MVIVRVDNGPQSGERSWLQPGESLTVGRDAGPAKLAIESDGKLSRQHFRLESDGFCCKFTDLGSKNGTLVNGRRIEQTQLWSGDRIVAGNTTFCVRVFLPTGKPAWS